MKTKGLSIPYLMMLIMAISISSTCFAATPTTLNPIFPLSAFHFNLTLDNSQKQYNYQLPETDDETALSNEFPWPKPEAREPLPRLPEIPPKKKSSEKENNYDPE